MNTEKIYNQAKDEHVACVMVYAVPESGNGFVAYKDDEHTERFTVAELRDAFLKGCIVGVNNFYYVKPTQFTPMRQFETDFGYLFGYYNNNVEEDGNEDTLLQVFTWDGERPME